jgi:cellulose synthase operon protein C
VTRRRAPNKPLIAITIAAIAILAIVPAATFLFAPDVPTCARPEVEFAGCMSFHDDVCVLPPEREIFVWVRDVRSARIEVQGSRESVRVQDGTRHRVRVDPGRDVIDATAIDGECRASVGLRVRRDDRPRWAIEAVEARDRGDLERSEALARAHAKSRDPHHRGLAHAVLARVAIRRNRIAPAIRELRRAIAAHRSARRPLEHLRDASALAFTLSSERRLAEAREVLERVPAPRRGSPSELDGDAAYFRGVVAGDSSDSRGAIAHYERSRRWAERSGDDILYRNASSQLAAQQLMIGQTREAIALMRSNAPPPDALICERAMFETNYGWALLIAGEAGMREEEDPTPILERALAHTQEGLGRCPFGPQGLANAHVNLAFARIREGRADLARRELDLARAAYASPPIWLRSWSLDLEGRVAILEADTARALRYYEALDALASDALSLDGRWRAAVGRAQAFEMRGDTERAIAALEEAEAVVDEQSASVPLSAGRELFLAQRERATATLISLSVERGEIERAFAIARRARARVLRSALAGERVARLGAAERRRWDEAVAAYHSYEAELERELGEEWTIPSDALDGARERRRERREHLRALLDRAFASLPRTESELRPIARGELALLYHPARDGWIGFAATHEGVRAHVLDAGAMRGTSERIAERLLDPFAAELSSARRVRVFAHGAVRALDFHALPFRGRALGERATVVYALDLPSRDHRSSRRALVVADPRGDLPRSREEADAVRDQLGGWRVETLLGDGADRPNVLRALRGVGLFHYAGHAAMPERPLDGSLELAGRTELGVGDVLLLRGGPNIVVLSACATASATPTRAPEGLGMAYAFVLAGADAVIAATRTVRDGASARIARELYRAFERGGDPARALQQLRLRALPDAGAFRVFVP